MDKQTKAYIKEHTISFIQTFAAIMAVDGVAIMANIGEGDFSKATLLAVAGACIRGILKALMQEIQTIKKQ